MLRGVPDVERAWRGRLGASVAMAGDPAAMRTVEGILRGRTGH